MMTEFERLEKYGYPHFPAAMTEFERLEKYGDPHIGIISAAPTDNHKALVERVRPALKLLDGLEIGQRCEEHAYAEANGFQAMTYIPEAFEALRALPEIIAALQSTDHSAASKGAEK